MSDSKVYDLKLKDVTTKMTKAADVCHDCVKEKGLLRILGEVDWKVWDKESFSWKLPKSE